MGSGDSGARGESVWADLRVRRAQAAVVLGAPTREALTRPSGLGGEPVGSFEAGTIDRLVQDEVAATLEMADDLAGWAGAKALDAIRNAEFSVNQVQRSMTGLAQELHAIAESMYQTMPATAPKEEASFDAGPWDLVEIPPSQDVPDYQRLK